MSVFSLAITEEIKKAIRDEPQRRWDQQPRKRCVEQDLHPIAATSASFYFLKDAVRVVKIPPRLDAKGDAKIIEMMRRLRERELNEKNLS